MGKHERIHNDTGPYECMFCGKTFTTREEMKVHIGVHNGDRPYSSDNSMRSGNVKKCMKINGTCCS